MAAHDEDNSEYAYKPFILQLDQLDNTFLGKSNDVIPVTCIDTLTVHIHPKYKYPEVQEFINEITKSDENSSVSILSLYVLKTTSKPVDMSHMKGYKSYKPNLSVRQNDAWGSWNYHHLLNLFELEYIYQSYQEQFPLKWQTTVDTKIVIICISQSDDIIFTAHDSESNLSLLGILKKIAQCNTIDDTLAQDWYTLLKKENIYTIEHLQTVISNEICWEKISSVQPFAKCLIRDYVLLNLASLSDNPTVIVDPYQNSRATLLGDIHRVRRYFHHINGSLTKIPCLDRRAIDLAIDEIRVFYDDDGNILKTIQSYLQRFCSNNTLPTQEEHDNQRCQWENDHRLLENTNNERREQLKNVKTHLDRLSNEVKLQDVHLTNLRHESKDVYKKAAELRIKAQDTKNNSQWRSDASKSQNMKNGHEDEIKTAKNNLEKLQNQYTSIGNEYMKSLTDIKTDERKMADLDQFLKVDLKEQYKKLTVKYGRGLLLYGPPGTGKSKLLKHIAIYTGIAMVTVAISAGELNRPYVGETERILVAMMSRANTISYLICVMTIDEIDGLAPKRDSQTQSSKVDGISVLLSHIEGAKDIPNLIVFGATNRMNMMDEAFLRRMQGKCFVGRPSPNIRKKMLQPLLFKNPNILSTSIIDFLVKLTTNFSGAAIDALRSSIVVSLERIPDSIDTHYLLTLTDNVAREFSCWFGISTLPDVCRRHSNIFSQVINEHSLILSNLNPSGRILVDLEQKSCLIELKGEDEPSLEEALAEHETSLLSLLARFISGCSSRNIDSIQIIDLNFLTQHNAFNDNQIFELLSTTIFECNEYNRSMFIFDIDSLIILNVSDSGTSETISINNNNLYQFIRQQCGTANVENKKDSIAEENIKEKWIVMIVKHPWLRRRFVDDIEFKKTIREIKYERDEEEKRLYNETEQTCPKCLKTYIPAKINYGNCHYHNGFVFNVNNRKKLTQNEAENIFRVAQVSNMIDGQQQQQQPILIWACCLRIYNNDSYCQTGVCGLPKELKNDTNDSSERPDPINRTQEYYMNSRKAQDNFDAFFHERKPVSGGQSKYSERKT